MLVGQPAAGIEEGFVQVLHHQVDGSAVGATHKAAVAIAANGERQRGVVVVVERAERLVPHDAESKSLRDPLNGEVAKLLKF